MIKISVVRTVKGIESGTVTVITVVGRDGHTVEREIDLAPVANGMSVAWWTFQKMAEVLNEALAGVV